MYEVLLACAVLVVVFAPLAFLNRLRGLPDTDVYPNTREPIDDDIEM